jgi:adenylate cyclase
LIELGIICYVRAEYQKGLELSEELLNLVEDSGDPILLALGHWKLGVVLFAIGKYTASHKHLKEVIDIYHPDQHQQYILLRGSDPGASAMAYNACCLWVLGYPDQALTCSKKALALARELDHPFTLADVLCYAGCMFSAIRLDAHSLKFYAEQLIQLSSEKLPPWQGPGTWYRGESLAMMGKFEDGIDQMHQGLDLMRSLNVMCYTVGILGTLANTLTKIGRPNEGLRTMAKAFRLVDKTDERHWEAELYRMQAEILLSLGNEADAEISLNKSIEVARHQNAKSWELRATTDLARVWKKQGKNQEAQNLLEQIYNWFKEGFDTTDLTSAKELMDALSKGTKTQINK